MLIGNKAALAFEPMGPSRCHQALVAPFGTATAQVPAWGSRDRSSSAVEGRLRSIRQGHLLVPAALFSQ